MRDASNWLFKPALMTLTPHLRGKTPALRAFSGGRIHGGIALGGKGVLVSAGFHNENATIHTITTNPSHGGKNDSSAHARDIPTLLSKRIAGITAKNPINTEGINCIQASPIASRKASSHCVAIDSVSPVGPEMRSVAATVAVAAGFESSFADPRQSPAGLTRGFRIDFAQVMDARVKPVKPAHDDEWVKSTGYLLETDAGIAGVPGVARH